MNFFAKKIGKNLVGSNDTVDKNKYGDDGGNEYYNAEFSVKRLDSNRKYSPYYMLETFLTSREAQAVSRFGNLNIKKFETYGDKSIQFIITVAALLFLNAHNKGQVLQLLEQIEKYTPPKEIKIWQGDLTPVYELNHNFFEFGEKLIENEMEFIYGLTYYIHQLMQDNDSADFKKVIFEFEKRTYRLLDLEYDRATGVLSVYRETDVDKVIKFWNDLFQDERNSKGALFAFYDIICKTKECNGKHCDTSQMEEHIANYARLLLYEGFYKIKAPQVMEDIRYVTQPFSDYFDRVMAPLMTKFILENENYEMLDLGEGIRQIFRNYRQIARSVGTLTESDTETITKEAVSSQRQAEMPRVGDGTILMERSDMTIAISRPFLKGKMENQEKVIVITKDRFSIGRQPEMVDYALEKCKSISRIHAEIQCSEGVYTLIDKNSSNGTFINGDRVVSGKAHEIKNNDKIMFANAEFEFIIT